MLDRSNINRVKGILSAKKGAEIPKFQLPAGPLPIPFSIQNGKYYLDNKEVTKEVFFQDPRVQKAYENHVAQALTDPSSETTSTVQPITATNPTIGSLNGAGAQTQVVGGTTTDPNASVVKAAEVVTQVANELDRQKALLLALAVAEATKEQQKVVDTAGMNFNSDKDDDEDGNGKNGWKNLKEQALNAGISAFNGIGLAVGAQQATIDSNTTKAVDTTYDTVSGIAENFGPVGKFVGTAMKNAAIAGDIIQSLGGGTDQLTTTDKWMDSSFFSWNIGMINGFFGKEADKFSADQDILASVGSSYGGTSFDINEAAKKSGKKYGLFSSGARMKANQEMAEARAKQNIMGDISDTAAMQRFSVLSMGELAGLAYSMLTDGGYNLKYTYAAKQGGVIEWNPVVELEWQPQVELNWDLHILKEGGTIDLTEELEWIPEFQSGGKTRTLELLIEYAKEKNPRFIQRLSESPHGIEFIDDEGNKGIGNVYLEWGTDNKGNAVIYPRILEMNDKSLKFLSSDEAWERANKNNNVLIMSPEEAQIFFAEDPEYLTAYKRGWPKMFKNYSEKAEIKEEYPQEYIDFKNSLPDNLKNTPESEYRTYLYWQLWGKPKDFQYTLEHPSEDGDYMYNWDESDKSYHGSSIAWGKDRIGYFIKPKHHSTLKYELDWFNKGIITEEGGKQREMTPEERKAWEDFRRNYTLEEDGNFYKYVPIKQSESFKTGGTIKDSLETPEIEETTLKNVIPEGALHKNKHHMDHAEGLTKKGIPVIDEDGELQAEIELNEIIFTLEVTKQLEEYYNIFYSEESTNKEKEQAALDAGKLLVYQILENTEDRTGLIESCKKGGTLQLKKSTDDLIEEVLDWMPTLVVVEEVVEEIKEKEEEKPKKKSEKEQMKEAIKEVLIELLTK